MCSTQVTVSKWFARAKNNCCRDRPKPSDPNLTLCEAKRRDFGAFCRGNGGNRHSWSPAELSSCQGANSTSLGRSLRPSSGAIATHSDINGSVIFWVRSGIESGGIDRRLELGFVRQARDG